MAFAANRKALWGWLGIPKPNTGMNAEVKRFHTSEYFSPEPWAIRFSNCLESKDA